MEAYHVFGEEARALGSRSLSDERAFCGFWGDEPNGVFFLGCESQVGVAVFFCKFFVYGGGGLFSGD